MRLSSDRTYAFWLALLRIFLGIFWIARAIPKFTTGFFMPPDGISGRMLVVGSGSTTGAYHDFLVNVVTPHVVLFANLDRFGELLVGVLLLLGLFARLGALGGMFLLANYMLVRGEMTSLHGWTGLDGLAFAVCALNFVVPTGRMIGFDAFLGRPKVEPVSAARPHSEPSVSTASGTPVHAEFVEEEPVIEDDPPRST